MVSEEFKNLDVLFLTPPVWRIMGKKWNAYPLGLGYLVSSLNQIRIKSAIYHANYLEVDECSPIENMTLYMSKQWEKYYAVTEDSENEIWKELIHVLKITTPKIVGISSTIVDLPATNRIVEIIKKINKDIIVIVGGASATTYSEKLMQNPQIDCLVMGEGERTVQELVPILLQNPLDWERLEKVKGIKYRIGGNDVIEWAIKTEPRELIKNLDEIPFPDREKMFIVTRSGDLKKIYLPSDILLSRGCAFKCKFCSTFTIWGTHKPRSRSSENIIKEIIELKTRYNQNQFTFWDDLFTLNRSRVVKLCNDLIQQNIDIKWACLVRIDTVDKELLDLMKKAGCINIQFGIESGSDRVLSYIKKGLTKNQIIEKAKIIRECKIPWHIFLIIGFPDETEQEIEETIQFIDILKPDSVDLSIFSPYPGTEFYTELVQSGHITENSDRSDPFYLDKSYTLKIPEERFKEIAVRSLKYVNHYNNKITSPGKGIMMGIRVGGWWVLNKATALKRKVCG